MVRATWNGMTLAGSDQTIVVERDHYFPADAINEEYFQPSDIHTTCSWNGVASYYTVAINGQTNRLAAWYYPAPKEAAENITAMPPSGAAPM